MLNKPLISIIPLKKAAYQLQLAEHLLEVTYPMIKDPKMLLSVLSNLEQTHNHLFESVLPSNLVTAETNFISKLNSFEQLLAPHIVLDDGIIKTIKSVNDLKIKHKESGVVFGTKDSYVICDENYHLDQLDALSIGEQLRNTKKLTKKIFNLVKDTEDFSVEHKK